MPRKTKPKPLGARSVAKLMTEIGHSPDHLPAFARLADKLRIYNRYQFIETWPRDCQAMAKLTYDVAENLSLNYDNTPWRHRWAKIGGELGRALIGASGREPEEQPA